MNWTHGLYALGALVGVVGAYKYFFGGSASAAAVDTSAGAGHAPPTWGAADYRALNASAGRLRMNPADLLLVEYSESRLNPAASYPGGIAVGINQLTSASNGLTGLSEDERANVVNLSVGQQIPIVERYFRNLPWTQADRGYPSAGVVYAMNFLPARAMERGASPDTVLGTVDEFPQDKGLSDGSGNYTVRSLENELKTLAGQPTYLGALQALRDAVGDQSISPRFAT